MYEIYAYGNNESLYGIFNAIAAIMGADSYLQAVAIVAFCGFVTAAFAYAFMPHKLIGWQWLASVLLVYSILFVPKVTVGIVDKLGTQPVQVVSNVPFGVAFFGNLTSTIGNTLTEVFETAFQTLPGPAQQSADLTYQRHGVMFGNTLIKRTRQIVFDDPNFRTDLVNFIHNCTMFDLADGTIDPAAFSKAPAGAGDLWSLMATPNPARFSSITTGGVSDIQPCPAVYANLNARLPAMTDLSVQKLAALLNPDLPLAQAVTEVSNQATQAYLRASLGGAGIAVADIVRQNGLINAINDTSDIIGQKINDPGSLILGLGRAQATAQTNAAWLNFGKMAEDALPLIRNAIEAIIYALFPLVILLLLLTYGLGTMRALQSYLLTLVWIQLWPPVYAILNYMASIASAKHIAAAAELGAGINGLAIVSASPVYANTISDQAVVGYLVLAVPAIAWAAVKGMHTIGQAALTGTSSIQGAASGAAAAAATGNLALGVVSQDQVNLSPTYSSAHARFSTDAWGTRAEAIRGDGSVEFVAAQQNMSRLATRFEFSEREATSMSDSARTLEATASSQREAAAQSTAATLVNAMNVQQEYARSGARSGGSSLGTAGRDSRDVNTMLQIAENVNKMLGYEGNAVAGKQIVADASVGLKALGMGAGTSFRGSTEENERLKRAFDYAKSQLQNSGIATGKSIAENFQITDAYEWAKRSGASGAERFDSSFRQAEDFTRSAEKSHLQSQEQARMAQFMREVSMGVRGDASNYLARKLDETGRLGEYYRADPLTQKQMTLDIAREYANGALGMNNEYVPYGGGGTPSRHPGAILDFDGDLNEAYRRIELEGGSAAEINAKKAAYEAVVRAKQRAADVAPGRGPRDDVSGRANNGVERIRETQEKQATSIVTESRKRQADYYSGTGEAAAKIWTNAVGDVSDDARKVIDEVAGINRGEPNRLIKAPSGPQHSKINQPTSPDKIGE
jgi:conjugal transfer mating pair stabilization protein TraG